MGIPEEVATTHVEYFLIFRLHYLKYE